MHRCHFDLFSSESPGDVRKEVVHELEAALQGPSPNIQLSNLVLNFSRLDEPSVKQTIKTDIKANFS